MRNLVNLRPHFILGCRFLILDRRRRGYGIVLLKPAPEVDQFATGAAERPRRPFLRALIHSFVADRTGGDAHEIIHFESSRVNASTDGRLYFSDFPPDDFGVFDSDFAGAADESLAGLLSAAGGGASALAPALYDSLR